MSKPTLFGAAARAVLAAGVGLWIAMAAGCVASSTPEIIMTENEQRSATRESAAEPRGEVLYNGIILPSQWPRMRTRGLPAEDSS